MLTFGDVDQGVAGNGNDLHAGAVGADVNDHRRVVTHARDIVLVARAHVAAGAVARVRSHHEDVDGATLKGVGGLLLRAGRVRVDVDDLLGELRAEVSVDETGRGHDEEHAAQQDGECAAQEAEAPVVDGRVLDRPQNHVTHWL